MRELYDAHHSHAQFLFVHVSEAQHPIAEVMQLYHAEGLRIDVPADRPRRAELTMQHYGLTFPCLLDTDDQEAELVYDAWPGRLVIVDQDGRVALDAGRSVMQDWDFDAIETWLNTDALATRSGGDPSRASAVRPAPP